MRRDNHWEMVSSIVAIVVGCLALGVTAYTAFLQRRQAHASVWPRLVFDESGPDYHYVAVNKGVGPAIVHSMEVLVDGKPVSTWDAAVRALVADADKHPATTYATMSDAVLVAGETRNVLSFGDEEMREAMRQARARISVHLCYCSIFDECWSLEGGSGRPRPVAECPPSSPSSFQQ